MSQLIFNNQSTAPDTPAAGKVKFYTKTDKNAYMKDEDGTETKINNGGDVTGPASSTDNAAVRWNGTGGDAIQDSSATIDDNGSVNIPSGQSYKINSTALAYTDITNSNGSSAVIADNAIVRGDGGARAVQSSSATVSDTGTINIPSGQTYNINSTALAYTDITNSVGSSSTITDDAIIRGDGGSRGAQSSSATIDDSGSINIPSGQSYKINSTALAYTDITNSVGAASTFATDNSILRADGTSRGAQATSTNATIDDSGNIVATSCKCTAFVGTDAVVANGDSGTSKTINWNDGNIQSVTMTGDCTFTFTAPTGAVGHLTLILTQDATGNRATTFPATVKAGGGFAIDTSNSDASEVDVVTFAWDGTTYWQISMDYDCK